MKKDCIAITGLINKKSAELRSKFYVKKIGIFGSVAHGRNSAQSDVDILVDFEKPIGFFDFIRLENFLSKLLKKRVDLVTKNALKPFIKKTVLNETIYA